MEAVVMGEFGGPQVLRLARFADPQPRPGWVVIRLQASALNWHDVLVRQGKYNSPLPHVIGADGAGVRTDTGEDVVILPSLSWGEDTSAPGPRWEILGDHRPGTYAELATVPEECVAPKPRGLSWAEAAALPLVGATAYRALMTRGRLRASESVLIIGASGGVASMAVALTAGIGASATVTSSSTSKIERARELGAAGGVLYTDADWVDAARDRTQGGRGFDVVLDPVGNWTDSLRCLRPGGRLVTLGANRAELAEIDIRRFYFGQYDLLGTTMGSPDDFAAILRLVADGTVAAPVVDRTFPLDDAAQAHEHLESGQGFGKVTLTHFA